MSVPSPCINVCRMTDDTGLCAGCFRTLEEIAAWSRQDDDGKRRILAAVATRRAACRAEPGDRTTSPEVSR